MRQLLVLLLLLGPSVHAGVEEARVPEAQAALPDVLETVDSELLADVPRADDPEALARSLGDRLWRRQVQASADGRLDDRPLYWQRLAARRSLRADCDVRPDLDCDALLDAFEWASRGAGDLEFPTDADLRILISGFDPFFLDRDITQGNPSGAAALALDGSRFGIGDHRVAIEALMIPVRFADFDAGRIETLFEPWLREDGADLVVTISMGRDAFDLERFPGRRRSAEAPDNRNVLTGASPRTPRIPRMGPGRILPGPEFVEFSLPAAAMRATPGFWAVRDNHRVTTLRGGTFEAPSLAALQGTIAVQGSGGGYLSNEISFRTVRLARALDSGVAVGHLHTPRISGQGPETVAAIVGQIRAILEAAAAAQFEPDPPLDLPVTDSCADCHPPLALPEAHPQPDDYSLGGCSSCHASGTPQGDQLYRAMHRAHVRDMGFDCTLCHALDAETLEAAETELERRLAE
ncbi:MAG: cytochrome c3 family protein [Gammaproteobacteria bacterium]|nr:cytochrome c3 family protein [Gammaproteobacteria bacterium]